MSCNNPCSIQNPSGISIEKAILSELKCRRKDDSYPSYELVKVVISIEKEICVPFPSSMSGAEKTVLINSIMNSIRASVEDKVNSLVECNSKVISICDILYMADINCECQQLCSC